MNTIKNILAISAIAMGIAMPISSFAQATMDHGKMDMSQASDSMTDGEVKKIDPDNGKVTLKHGDIEYKLKFNCKPCEMEIWEKDAELEFVDEDEQMMI